MLRVLAFIILIGALALIVLSLLRRTPRRSSRDDRRDDDDGEALALPRPPVPPTHAQPALSREATVRLLHELAFGTELAAHVPAAHVKIVTAAASALQGSAADPRYAPRRPLLLPELVRAVNDSDTTRRELAQMIARDPALVGSLLKLANSPIYRRSAQPIESLERALAVLGTQGARSLVAAALLQPVFKPAVGDTSRFPEIIWEHTQRAAAASELHATVVEGSDPFAAQLVALLFGLGAIVVYRVALDQYAARGAVPDATALASLLDEQVAKVARQIAAGWDLSGRVLDALEEQQPERSEGPASSLGRSLSFGFIVGALSVLRSHDRIDDETGRVALAAAGGDGERFERLWTRLALPPGVEPGFVPSRSTAATS
jgi:HD-like signal output (HDOD) protein